jgi:sec-independent protein translocase protein TatA
MLADIFGVDGVIVLIVVLVLLFGGAAIPKLARSLGSAKNEFEKGLEDGKKASVSPADPVNDGGGTADKTTPTPIRLPDHSNSKT